MSSLLWKMGLRGAMLHVTLGLLSGLRGSRTRGGGEEVCPGKFCLEPWCGGRAPVECLDYAPLVGLFVC